MAALELRRCAAVLLLVACATPEGLVRAAASKDFACPQESVAVETRSPREADVAPTVYVARGCGTTVVYGVGGEWFSSWAAPCAPVTVRGQPLRSNPFAGVPAALCADTIADAGAVAPEPLTPAAAADPR